MQWLPEFEASLIVLVVVVAIKGLLMLLSKIQKMPDHRPQQSVRLTTADYEEIILHMLERLERLEAGK